MFRVTKERLRIIIRVRSTQVLMRVIEGWWNLGTSWSRAINEVRVIDMLDSGMTDRLGTGRWHREVLIIDFLD